MKCKICKSVMYVELGDKVGETTGNMICTTCNPERTYQRGIQHKKRFDYTDSTQSYVWNK